MPTRMNTPGDIPIDTHCRQCGGQLEVSNVRRERVGGFFGSWQSAADTVCRSCGTESGAAWAQLSGSDREVPANPLARLIIRLRRRRGNMAIRPKGPAYRNAEGRLDLRLLLESAPFPVRGLNGRPLALRLRSPGWGGKGEPPVMHRVHFGYVSGDPQRPDRALELDQGDLDGGASAELAAITGLIHNYGRASLREENSRKVDIHRDWNLDRIGRTPHRQVTLKVEGVAVEADLASWEEPERVILARSSLPEGDILGASLWLSEQELLTALETLVVLQRDEEALAGHQRDYEEVSREMFPRLYRAVTRD